MSRTKRDLRLELPPLELECMKALWTLGEGSVHSIRAQLLPARPLAYTTVMTIMDRLARKGAAERRKRSRAYLYRPLVSEDQVRRQAIARLLTEHFGGSERSLRAYLGGAPVKPTAPAPRPAAPEPVPAGEPEIDAALL